MKKMKILLVITVLGCMLTTNCFAISYDNYNLVIENDTEYVYRNYIVTQDEEESFINSIENEINLNNKKYVFQNKTVEGGNTTETKKIKKSKSITSNTNEKEKLIDELGISEQYQDDEGYFGEYSIDKNSILIKTNYNGYYEYLIEETKEYKNLNKNDLDYLPKQIQKDNRILDLLNVTWQVENMKNIGENEVPDKYTAICYYATKQRIEYPNTYTVTANYVGEAKKIIENPLKYTLVYKEIKEEKNIDSISEGKDNKFIFVLGGITGTTTLFVVVFFIIRKNTTVYNFQNGKWVRVGRMYLSKNPKINLNKYSHLEISNKYKFELSKKAILNVKGKSIKILKENRIMKHVVNTKNDTYIFEITM